MKRLWVLGAFYVTYSQVHLTLANHMEFWQLIEDISIWRRRKKRHSQGRMSSEEVKSIFCLCDLKVKNAERGETVSQIWVKRNITSISAFTDNSIYKGQQPVWGKKLYYRTFQICNGEIKSGRALRGTEAKFKTNFIFIKEKSVIGPLLNFFQTKTTAVWVSTTHRICEDGS